MTALFASTGLNITINLLLVVFVLVCLLMSMIILMQRPKNEGLGAAFGSGATDQLFGAQTTHVLQKGTVYLGSLFFVLTITLAVLMSKRDHSGQTFKAEVEQTPPPVETPKEQPASILPPSAQPLEGDVATPPVQAPPKPDASAPTPAPAPAPEPAPAPADKPPGDAAPQGNPAPPPADGTPAEPVKPEGEEKPPGNP
jgi:preprotein translocase subunit SecG